MSDKKHAIGARRLQEALDEFAMRPVELAKLSGVAPASISQYLTGRNVPGNVSAEKIGTVLNVNPLWLMELSEEKRPNIKLEAGISEELAHKALALWRDENGRVILDAKEKLTAEQFSAVITIIKGMIKED